MLNDHASFSVDSYALRSNQLECLRGLGRYLQVLAGWGLSKPGRVCSQLCGPQYPRWEIRLWSFPAQVHQLCELEDYLLLGFRSSQPHLEIQGARLEGMIPDLRTEDLCGHEGSPLMPRRLSITRPSWRQRDEGNDSARASLAEQI